MPLIDGGTDIDLSKWEGVFVAALKKVGYDMLTNEAFPRGFMLFGMISCYIMGKLQIDFVQNRRRSMKFQRNAS